MCSCLVSIRLKVLSKLEALQIPSRDLSGCLCREQRTQLASSGPLLPTATSPLKTLMNLTTSVDTLAFSPDTQVQCTSALTCLVFTGCVT